ncbi:MAG: DotU family type IV/VI secretion system protein [Cytophagales bacterium]|nr:DotU family type IV/VI secretion system protein [Rhizobacter sp.]
MNAQATQPPSLFNGGTPGSLTPTSGSTPREARTLLDLMYDGFYLLFLLRAKQAPGEAETFRSHIKEFLTGVERGATKLGSSAEDVHLCKYAFCATVDELILMSQFKVRDAWQRQPLQLQFFGEQLAGEQFFVKLEALRREGAARIQILEVFHMCLLMGFQGKYIIEGSEKLNYLTARLGDEIAHLKGSRATFAPHWAPPDQVTNRLKNEVPLWVIASVFALLGVLAFTGLRWQLARSTERDLAAYQDVVKLAPQAAHVTITLP